MNKNLPAIKHSAELALSKANALLEATNKILTNQSTDLVDDSWIDRLWQWADDNRIPSCRDWDHPWCDYYSKYHYFLGKGSRPGYGFPRSYDWSCPSWSYGLNEFRICREQMLDLTSLAIFGGGLLPNKYPKGLMMYGLSFSSRLSELPKEIGNLVNIQLLNLQAHRIKTLPKEIGNLVNLRVFDFSCNGLEELPREVGGLVNLQTFDLQRNSLNDLPAEVSNLVNLQTLNLSGNNLTKIPKEIFSLVNLRTLNLSGNKLNELPKEIGNLVNLQILCLPDNELMELPKEITELKNLQHLELWRISDYQSSPSDRSNPYLNLSVEQEQYIDHFDIWTDDDLLL